MALTHINLCFASQAWRLLTSTFVLRGRRGTWRHRPWFCVAGVALMALGWIWWRAWSPLVARGAAALCVAGVALADIHVALRGRRGAWRHRPWFCVAGVALMALGWIWWRAWSPLVARGAAALCVAGVALADIHVALRGRRGAWRHRPSFCVAGVALAHINLRFFVPGMALVDIDLGFAWQAWRLWHWAGSGGALGRR